MPSLRETRLVPTRRSLLLVAVVCSLVLAGCTTGDNAGPNQTKVTDTTYPGATETTTPATTTPETTISDTTSTGMGADGWYHGYTFRADQTDLASIGAEVARTPDELDAEEASLVRQGASNGSVTVAHTGASGPLYNLDYVRVNDTYYEVSPTQVESESRKAFVFDVEGPITADSREYSFDRAKREAIAAENLPAPDRAVFFDGLPPAERRPAPNEGSFFVGFTYFYATDTAPENATFTDGETHFVAYDGTYFAVQFEENLWEDRSETRYTFEPVAQNQSAFDSIVREQYVTNLSTSELTADERELVRDIVENGSIRWSGDDSETPPEIRQRKEALQKLSPDRRDAYVEVDGEYYEITLVEVME